MNELTQQPPAALTVRTEEKLLGPARRAGYELPVIGTAMEPQGEVEYQAPKGQWWIFNYHRDDPTAALHGGVVVPIEVRQRLEQLLRHGFAPDTIWVGHEMPINWEPGQPKPDLVPQKRPATTDLVTSPRSPALPARSAEVGVAVGKGLLKVTKALVTGAAAAGLAIGSAMAELDPIIVAGVRDPSSGAVTFVEVARWSW
jgi:hypothetical protein